MSRRDSMFLCLYPNDPDLIMKWKKDDRERNERCQEIEGRKRATLMKVIFQG